MDGELQGPGLLGTGQGCDGVRRLPDSRGSLVRSAQLPRWCVRLCDVPLHATGGLSPDGAGSGGRCRNALHHRYSQVSWLHQAHLA